MYKQQSLEFKGQLHFDPIKHEYWLNGNLLLSVTQLLAKHGLTTDYGDVAPSILERAAKFGNDQHEELEQYQKGVAKYNEVNVITQGGLDLLKANNIETFLVEERLFNTWLAGTCDLIGIQNGKYVIVDYKFTSQLNTTAVMWQANIYKRLVWEQHQILIEKLYVLWYDKSKNEFQLRELKLLEDEEIDKLFRLESEGKFYDSETSLTLASSANQLQLTDLLKKLDDAKKYVENVEAQIDTVKGELMKEMEAKGISTFELDGYKLTYVKPTMTQKIDRIKMVKAYEDKIPQEERLKVEDYTTFSERKGYLTITKPNKTAQKAIARNVKRQEFGKKFAKKIK